MPPPEALDRTTVKQEHKTDGYAPMASEEMWFPDDTKLVRPRPVSGYGGENYPTDASSTPYTGLADTNPHPTYERYPRYADPSPSQFTDPPMVVNPDTYRVPGQNGYSHLAPPVSQDMRGQGWAYQPPARHHNPIPTNNDLSEQSVPYGRNSTTSYYKLNAMPANIGSSYRYTNHSTPSSLYPQPGSSQLNALHVLADASANHIEHPTASLGSGQSFDSGQADRTEDSTISFDSGQSTDPTQQRRRTRLACTTCRKRKIKCYPNKDPTEPTAPCQTCTDNGRHSCTFSRVAAASEEEQRQIARQYLSMYAPQTSMPGNSFYSYQY